MIIGTFRVGEDVSVAIDLVEGVAGDAGTVTAQLFRSTSATSFARAARSAGVALTVASRSASGDDPAGWNVTLTAAQSANLRPGVYGIDARHTVGGRQVVLTEATQLIRLTEAVG